MHPHSKAPFAVTGQSTGGRYITVSDADGRAVARVPFSRDDDPRPADASNANLFAAAPEMLASLRRAESILHAAAERTTLGHPNHHAWQSVRASIAKATGNEAEYKAIMRSFATKGFSL